MDKDYQIADLSTDCISEINELQDKLKQHTEKDIILVAYTPAQEKN